MQKILKWTLASLALASIAVTQGGLLAWEGERVGHLHPAVTTKKTDLDEPHANAAQALKDAIAIKPPPTPPSPSPSPRAPPPPSREHIKVELHTVATVGCGGPTSLKRGMGPSQTSVQVYQTFAAENSWYETGMEGEFTRVISGCKTDWDYGLYSLTPLPLNNTIIKQGEGVPEAFKYNRLHSYFSVSANNPNYAQGNKARILIEWLQEVKPRGEFFMMVDPDMLFTRSFSPVALGAKQGVPAAQVYQLELKWRTWLDEMCGADCEYFKTVTDHDAVYKYHAGPPYIFHEADFTPFLTAWKPLVDPIHSKYHRIESDMMAYVIAAVKMKLPHILLEKSDWEPGPGRGPLSGGCQGLMFRRDGLPDPPVLHYCSNYKVDTPNWFINKHWLRPVTQSTFHHIIDCEMPLLVEPSMNSVGAEDGTDIQKDVFWSGLTMVKGINAMLIAHKKKNCPPGVRTVLTHGLRFKESQGQDGYLFDEGMDPGDNNTHQGLIGVHSLEYKDGSAKITSDITERNTLRETPGWSWVCTSYATGIGCVPTSRSNGPFLVHPTAGTPVSYCGGKVQVTAECKDPGVALGRVSQELTEKMGRALYVCKEQTHSVGAACEGGVLLGYVG